MMCIRMTARGKKAQALFAIVTCCAAGFTLACGGGGSSSTQNSAPIPTSGQNVQTITVNSGPNGDYANGAFTSVIVCEPGTSTCQTITGVLVDTGSVGLRILSSALTNLSLPQQNGPSSNPVVECLPFVASYTWGPVQSADIQISGESASSVPIQVVNNTYAVPTQCSNFGGQNANTLQALGANGILGVGLYPEDCGGSCAQSSSNNLYYECSSSTNCQPITEPLASQVQNPVALFATDNNGVIIELPSVSGPEPTLSGSLIFGIGTQSNNGLGSASVYTLNSDAGITTQYQGQSYPNSFLDSGSNGFFFLDSSATNMPECSDNTGFYCPINTQNFSATNVGANGTSGAISFSVANADTLFSDNPTDTVFNQLGGPNTDSFDWGLPFFYGRNVYTAIDGKSTPQGTGPYWAY
jgi:hypothetical protein